MAKVRVIGVDCACEARNTGLALGEIGEGGELQTLALLSGGDVECVPSTVAGWMSSTHPNLLALDAPLGWPMAMGEELPEHIAGKPIVTPPDSFFRRNTDRVVQKELGKTPLDVGADRIARTAHAALTLLQEVKKLSGRDIPLAWMTDVVLPEVSAIEVYPAGTLLAHGIQSSGYKKVDQQSVRGGILGRLSTLMVLPADRSPMLRNANVLDAAVCLLAGADFLNGCCIPPTDQKSARIEGWIWVRRRQSLADNP